MNARAVCQFVVGFVLVALAGLYVNWSSHYFFLFDDFALFGEASRRTAAEIVTTPLFGFYRPLVFLLTKVEFGVFGWQHPEAALAISQSIHLINAGLAFLLARKLRLSMTASAVAAATFALSPWSSESYGWVSARFDVVSTSGVLSTLLLMMAASDAPGRGTRAVATVAGVVTTLVAVFAKESGALLPVYCAAVLLAKGPRLRMPWLFLLGVTTGVGVYLVCRHSVLPSLGGAYGSFPTLVADADIVANLGRYLLAFVAVPRPGFTPTASAGLVLVAAGDLVAGACRKHGGRALPVFAGSVDLHPGRSSQRARTAEGRCFTAGVARCGPAGTLTGGDGPCQRDAPGHHMEDGGLVVAPGHSGICAIGGPGPDHRVLAGPALLVCGRAVCPEELRVRFLLCGSRRTCGAHA